MTDYSRLISNQSDTYQSAFLSNKMRLDEGIPCGGGYIAKGKECHAGKSGVRSSGKKRKGMSRRKKAAIAGGIAGAAALGAGAYAASRMMPRKPDDEPSEGISSSATSSGNTGSRRKAVAGIAGAAALGAGAALLGNKGGKNKSLSGSEQKRLSGQGNLMPGVDEVEGEFVETRNYGQAALPGSRSASERAVKDMNRKLEYNRRRQIGAGEVIASSIDRTGRAKISRKKLKELEMNSSTVKKKRKDSFSEYEEDNERYDKGVPCGGGYIAQGKECRAGRGGVRSPRGKRGRKRKIAAGVAGVAALGAGAYAASKMMPRKPSGAEPEEIAPSKNNNRRKAAAGIAGAAALGAGAALLGSKGSEGSKNKALPGAGDNPRLAGGGLPEPSLPGGNPLLLSPASAQPFDVKKNRQKVVNDSEFYYEANTLFN